MAIATRKSEMQKRIALIIIGCYREEWQTLSADQKRAFTARVGQTLSTLALTPIIGYRLTANVGTFIEIWEAADPRAIERAIKNLEAFGYTRYVDARWIVGERAVEQRDSEKNSKGVLC